VLWQYLGNDDIYRCPIEEPPYPACNNITSYLMNRSVVAGSGLPDFRPWRTIDIITFVGSKTSPGGSTATRETPTGRSLLPPPGGCA
jgi:hypothetical protein